MYALDSQNPAGELITVQQAASLANLGIKTTRRIAGDAKAVVKIGRTTRIKRCQFFDYISETYSVEC